MRWLRGMTLVVSSLSLMVMWGCGSDSFGGTGQGTLQLMRFTNGLEGQPDFVGGTSALVDVCLNPCDNQGQGGQMMAEPFVSTQAAAVVINRGKSDITVERITVSYPGSGLADFNMNVAGGFAVPGGRCSNNATLSCGGPVDCAGAACVNLETNIPFTLMTLDRKDLIGGPNCLVEFSPEVIDSFVAISGLDAEGERFTISGGLVIEADSFDNCNTTN